MWLRQFLRVLRDEYRGWQRFHALTGFWPKWSILFTAVVSPIAFVCAGLVMAASFMMHLTRFLHWIVFLLVLPVALVWLALRRIASAADAAMPLRSAPFCEPRSDLEEILR
jgi:hypothetical protein